MVKLILVRHAITVDNEKNLLSGRADCELSEKGKEQAKHLNDYFLDTDIDIIFTSSSTRTRMTIEEIAREKDLNINIRVGLSEIDFGDFDRLKYSEIQRDYPDDYKSILEDGFEYRFPNGESLIESYNRVKKEIDNIITSVGNSYDLSNIDSSNDLEKNTEKSVLICAHAGTIRNILTYLISGSYERHWNYKISNASVSIVEVDGGFPVLTMLNNTEFLK